MQLKDKVRKVGPWPRKVSWRSQESKTSSSEEREWSGGLARGRNSSL